MAWRAADLKINPRFCQANAARKAITKALEPRSSQRHLADRSRLRPALPAATHTDRVFEALHAVSGAEGSLDRRLTYVRR